MHTGESAGGNRYLYGKGCTERMFTIVRSKQLQTERKSVSCQERAGPAKERRWKQGRSRQVLPRLWPGGSKWGGAPDTQQRRCLGSVALLRILKPNSNCLSKHRNRWGLPNSAESSVPWLKPIILATWDTEIRI
jgi:hypothetical protein